MITPAAQPLPYAAGGFDPPLRRRRARYYVALCVGVALGMLGVLAVLLAGWCLHAALTATKSGFRAEARENCWRFAACAALLLVAAAGLIVAGHRGERSAAQRPGM